MHRTLHERLIAMSIETFKPAFAAWMSYRELGDASAVWHDDPHKYDAPNWIEAGIYAYGGDGNLEDLLYLESELYQEFEKLMEKHGVWCETEYAFLWLYRADKFDKLSVDQDPRITTITFRGQA